MKWKWLVFGLLVLSVVAQGWKAAKTEALSKPSYGNVKAYLRSAECARTTGKILVICDGAQIRPIAEINAADDPGHALFLDLYSALSGNLIDYTDVTVLNALINALGIFALAGLLVWLRLPLVAITLLALAPIASGHYLLFSQHTAQFGGACLAMMPALVILTTSPFDKRKSAIGWLVAAVAALALASLLRQAIGLMGLVAADCALAYKVLSVPRTLRHLGFYAVVLGVLLASYQAPLLVFTLRNLAYGLAPSGQMETHGIWHNLYIGLGVVGNPFGIIWDDTNGFEHARAIDPNVKYISKHYYDVLRDAYFDIVAQHPLTVARIYIEKLTYAITRDRVWLMIVLSAIPAIHLRRAMRSQNLGNIDAVFVVSGLFVCFFLGQAALFHWDIGYRFPMTISFILMLGISIDILVRQRMQAVRLATERTGSSA